jgi:hypothetical protein
MKHHPKVKKQCLNCCKDILVFYADIERGRGKFCSRSCWDKYKRKLPEFIECKHCHKKFKNITSQRNKVFCSKDCQTMWQKGKPAYPNIVGKRGIKPRTYFKNKREKHGCAEDIDWRNSIFKRDNWTCQECKVKGGRLEAHHKKPFKKFPELRFELSNGITLCKECHKKTDSYGWQNYWKNHSRKTP